SMQVRWVEDDLAAVPPPNPSGFIVQATLPGRRSFHQRVPTAIVSDRDRPRLVLASQPDLAQTEEIALERLRLRPLSNRQPFYLFVKNPGPTPRDLVVELQAGSGGEPKTVKVKVDASSPKRVGNFVPPPGPEPGKPLDALNGSLRFRLLDE